MNETHTSAIPFELLKRTTKVVESEHSLSHVDICALSEATRLQNAAALRIVLSASDNIHAVMEKLYSEVVVDRFPEEEIRGSFVYFFPTDRGKENAERAAAIILQYRLAHNFDALDLKDERKHLIFNAEAFAKAEGLIVPANFHIYNDIFTVKLPAKRVIDAIVNGVSEDESIRLDRKNFAGFFMYSQ
jgi:hypothetical protein